MKDNYDKSIQLQCTVCGSDDKFECNEENSYIKCTNCGKEYFGGYDELVECNQQQIEEQVNNIEEEMAKDFENDIDKIFRDAFRGNKYIKFK